jgi:hypothetical protein
MSTNDYMPASSKDDTEPVHRAVADSAKPDERNERVLHTRVPNSLDRQLKRRARGLGMSVSTVVRHVLLNTFGLVEDIVNDSTNIALAITGEDTPPNPDRPRAGAAPSRAVGAAEAAVLGWQEAILNRNAVCDQCNAILRRGKPAAIGVREQPGAAVVICRRCLETLTGTRASRPRR